MTKVSSGHDQPLFPLIVPSPLPSLNNKDCQYPGIAYYVAGGNWSPTHPTDCQLKSCGGGLEDVVRADWVDCGVMVLPSLGRNHISTRGWRGNINPGPNDAAFLLVCRCPVQFAIAIRYYVRTAHSLDPNP